MEGGSGGDAMDDDDDEWSLDDLSLSADNAAHRPPPSATNLCALVDTLHEEWVDPTVPLTDWLVWATERFGLDVNRGYSYDDLDLAFKERWYQYKNLLNLGHQAGIFDLGDTVDRIDAIRRVIGRARRACVDTLVAFDSMKETRVCKIPPKVVDDDDSLENHTEDSLTSFQRLILIMCKRFEAKRYRKCGDSCFRGIRTPEGYNTRAFEFCCTIKSEVYGIQKEVDFRDWRILTNPSHNPRAVTDYLVESEQSEFRSLCVGDGVYFSFRDGIYDIERDLFFVYTDESQWKAYAADMAAARGVPAPGYPYPNDSTVCINYFSTLFRFLITPTAEHALLQDPMSIPTPAFDKILNSQGFTYDTIKWTYVLTGRLFFLINRHDRWTRAWLIIGAGGTGKSTIANWIMHAIPSHFHSIVNANFEEQFGLSGITGDEKRVCLCTELTEDLKFKQEEWQVCVEGGKLQVAHKNQTSRPHTFQQHMFFVGNQFPRRWKNNGKQVSRRVVLHKFSRPVPKAQLQGNLADELIAETDAILRKSALLYMRAAAQYGNDDLEAPGILPDEMLGFMKSMEVSMDPLTMFLESGQLTVAPSVYMPINDIKRDYLEFRRTNGFLPTAWTKDHWETTFATMGLHVSRATLSYRGETRTIEWVHGICPPDEAEALGA